MMYSAPSRSVTNGFRPDDLIDRKTVDPMTPQITRHANMPESLADRDRSLRCSEISRCTNNGIRVRSALPRYLLTI
jgi:hypothetical protein